MSRIAILSDVHSNFYALEAVLSHASKNKIDEVFFLGDAVGYGPEPHRVMTLLMENVNSDAWVVGNHDEAMRYPTDDYGFFESGDDESDRLAKLLEPRASFIGILKDTLTAFQNNYSLLEPFPDSLEFLLDRSTEARIDNELVLVHGGVRHDTRTTTYTSNRFDARDEFIEMETIFKDASPNICFVGHTHVPACFTGAKGSDEWEPFTKIDLQAGTKVELDDNCWLLNCGSVGQPRDGDWRAAYIIFDRSDNTLELHRVEYDIQSTQKCMESMAWPQNLVNRLARGR